MTHGPAFQFYPNDWLSSSKIAVMTPAEEGAYIRLLCYAWNDPDCTLPDDDEILANLSRLGEGWLQGASVKLRACFVPHPKKSGRLFNARLLHERKKQNAWRKKSSEGGKRSAELRASKTNRSGRMVEGCLNGGSRVVEPKANSSSSSSSSKEKKENTCALNGHSGHAWEEGFKQFWAAYPKKKSKANAERWFATHRPAAELVDQILAKIAEFKTSDAWQENEGRFVPYASKWLDAKGWEDVARVDVPRKPRRLAL